MSCSDFVGDFLTSIRNSSRAGKDKVTLKASKVTIRLAEVLKEEGFIQQAKEFKDGEKRFVRLHLKYVHGKRPAIQGLKRISRPGLRNYVNSDHIPRVQGGLGIAIISTSKGVMTDRKARAEKIGGEVICSVW
ncbi:MAG: 30S ribosomal protein S8 [Candidatus Omnitrophota bacterium]|nr:30S ribosomal protein S8 [Candidatus Omnitrophota bacterium]